MPRIKETARRGNFNKRPRDAQKEGSVDRSPPSKKAKNKLSASTSPDTSKSSHTNTTSTEAPPVQSSTSFNPPPEPSALLTALQKSHDLTTQSIISSTHIQKKVLRVLGVLSVYPTPSNEKHKLVMLHAKAPCASKMISVAEICKSELSREGGKWFAYCRVESAVEEAKEKRVMKPKARVKGREEDDGGQGKGSREDEDMSKGDGQDEESEEDSTAFETMKTPFERANEGKTKVRAVPVMSLYLSRVRVDALRRVYG